jgi:hypothetical protein
MGAFILRINTANMVKVIGPDHKLLATLGSGQADKNRGWLNKPEGVAARGRNVWISDTYTTRILRYRVNWMK